MGNCARTDGIRPRSLALLLWAAAVGPGTAASSAAERMVLGEFFTDGICALCPGAAAEVEGLIDTYPDDLAVVEYHVQNPFSEPFGEQRAEFYNVWGPGVPWFGVDGLGDAGPVSNYQPAFDSRRVVPTTVTLSVGAVELAGLTYRVSARACVEPGGSSLDLRLHIVVVEDHYPAVVSHARNTFRVAAAAEDVTLSSQQCYRLDRDITLDASWNQPDLRIIAWAQAPAASGPAEVHQSGKDPWPFDPLPAVGDWDNDGDVDLDDFSHFGQCLTGPSPPVLPSQSCREAFDADGDADVDAADFAAFQREFASGPSARARSIGLDCG